MKHLGDKGEFFVQKTLVSNGVDCSINQDKEKRYDYDLVCNVNKHPFTCEVKFDIMASKTGNIAVETWNSKKNTPSGINITKADIWIFVLVEEGYQAWAISVKNFKKWLENNKPKKIITHGGDKNATLSIFPKDKILPEFKRIDLLTEKELKEWLITIITS